MHLPATDVPIRHTGYNTLTSFKKFPPLQMCSVVLKVRKLETAMMRLKPKIVTMESDTVLTQYIVKKW